MVEVLAAAAAAVISAGSAAALAAARRAGETRDSLLILNSTVNRIDMTLGDHIRDSKIVWSKLEAVEDKVNSLHSRVTALENGYIDRRASNH